MSEKESYQVLELTREDIDSMNKAHIQYLSHPETLASRQYIKDAIRSLEVSWGLGEIPQRPLIMILDTIKAQASKALSKMGISTNKKNLMMISFEADNEMIEVDEQARSFIDVILSVNNLKNYLKNGMAGYETAEETFMLMLALVRANMGNAFIEGIQALVTRKRGQQKGGSYPKSAPLIKIMIEESLIEIDKQHKLSAGGSIFTTFRASKLSRSLWSIYSNDYNREHPYKAPDDSLVYYIADKDKSDDIRAGYLVQEEPDGKIYPITYGTFERHYVSEVFRDLKKLNSDSK